MQYVFAQCMNVLDVTSYRRCILLLVGGAMNMLNFDMLIWSRQYIVKLEELPVSSSSS